jgi:hypothetical protein
VPLRELLQAFIELYDLLHSLNELRGILALIPRYLVKLIFKEYGIFRFGWRSTQNVGGPRGSALQFHQSLIDPAGTLYHPSALFQPFHDHCHTPPESRIFPCEDVIYRPNRSDNTQNHAIT